MEWTMDAGGSAEHVTKKLHEHATQHGPVDALKALDDDDDASGLVWPWTTEGRKRDDKG